MINKLKEYTTSLYSKGIEDDEFKKYPNNIIYMSDSYRGIWGSISLVYMELSAYTLLFDMVKDRQQALHNQSSNYQWSHVINLSINDFPTTPLSKMEEYFSIHPNTNFMEECCLKDEFRFSSTYYEVSKGYIDAINKKKFEDFDCGIYGNLHYFDKYASFGDGTQWHFLTYRYAQFLIGDLKSIEKLFSLKFSLVPDETFFQTVKRFYPLLNDHDSQEKFDKTLKRDTMWNNNPDARDQSRYAVELKDIDNIKNLFFVRKVYSKEVKDAILKNLHHL